MFIIDEEKTIYYSADAAIDAALNFNSEGDLMSLADEKDWSREHLEEIWNGFAGVVPFDELKRVKKFRNRPFAVKRIWEVVQRLAPGGAETVAPVAEEEVAEKPPAAPKVKKAAASNGNKKDEAIRMMRRERGASASELVEKFGWQPHTLRGFISTLGSKHGMSVSSEKSETRGRVYKIAS